MGRNTLSHISLSFGGVLEGGGREELCDIVRKILFRASPCHILFLEQSSGGKAEITLRYV
jgi:hypothetical protein